MASYWFTDIGTLNAGNIIEVKMNLAANVRIMAAEEYDNYKKKLPHKFIGGYVKFSPYMVKLPSTQHWYIVVDRGGKEGKVSAAVTVYQKEKKAKEKQVILPED